MPPKSYMSLRPLIPWRREALPLDWEQVFGRAAPVELEIGFGNGERLARRVRDRPDLNLVGLDASWPSVHRCLRKIGVQGLENLRLLLGDATAILRLAVPAESLCRVVSLFPCPWPGDKTLHRRLFSRSFWELLNSRLAPGGFLRLLSDHEEYFHWVLGQCPEDGFSVSWGLTGERQRTKYERKWRGLGRHEFFELNLIKTASLGPKSHKEAVLRFPRLQHFDHRDFVLGEQSGEPLVLFKELLFDPQKEQAMILTVVVEDGYRLSFWLEVRRHQGQWRIRVAKGCQAPPTKGVQRALALAACLGGGSQKHGPGAASAPETAPCSPPKRNP